MNPQIIINSLVGSPYSLESSPATELGKELLKIQGQVNVLRNHGRLTQDTLERYYGTTRYEQVAESNAIEGSPLTVGETELAVLKGTTLTGLDPGYVRDAQSLNKALVRLVEMARNPAPLDILQVKELHSLILEGHHGAGSFRTEPVSISGSTHKPPPTWKAVMDEMEKWEAWSFDNKHLDPILRGVVWCCTVGLHTFIRLLTEMVELHARSQTSNLSGKVILRSSYGETKIVSDTSMGYVSLTMLGIFRN